MSQVDNRNPSTAKRARTDGGRREDDWTCPGCGNVNFSFRTTCNMRNCTQPRPADHNGKSAVKPMQPHQPYASSGPYGGASGAPPSSMYLGMPPYGSSMFNGSSVPPYDVPYSGGSAYPYNYPNRMSGGSPYRPMPMSGPPPPYSGGMYGMPPPMMDRYGMSMPHMAPPAMGQRPGFFSDNNSQKKDMPRDNDWICPKCGNVNFSFRITCNMRKCGTPKPGLQVPKGDKNPKGKMPDGSWKCEKCGNSNFPFRNKCNRQNCGAEKPAEEIKTPSPEAEEPEQVCFVIYLLCLSYGLVVMLLCLSHMYTYFHYAVFTSDELWLKTFYIKRDHRHLLNLVFLCLFEYFTTPHSIDLKLSTVPVSTRTCLVVWKVQSCRRPACSVSMSESQSCRRSSSLCSGLPLSISHFTLCRVRVLSAMVSALLRGSYLCFYPAKSGEFLSADSVSFTRYNTTMGLIYFIRVCLFVLNV